MYINILLPTDGSALSESAAESAIRLAKALGARIIGLHVTPKFSTAPLEAWAHGDRKSRSRLKALFDEQGERYLAVVQQKARDAGVRCECLCVSGESPYEEIVKTARNHKCEFIWPRMVGRARRRCCSGVKR
jgi:nucleotide-binding universal stress UspA family protein